MCGGRTSEKLSVEGEIDSRSRSIKLHGGDEAEFEVERRELARLRWSCCSGCVDMHSTFEGALAVGACEVADAEDARHRESVERTVGRHLARAMLEAHIERAAVKAGAAWTEKIKEQADARSSEGWAMCKVNS